MEAEKSNFLKTLSKEATESVPLHCTGFPEEVFMEKYIETYNLEPENDKNFILNNKDYTIIKLMGFDAISLWEYRKRKGEAYKLNNNTYVDSWGRIYRNNWYSWDGVLKDESVLEAWKYLALPPKESIEKLRNFIHNIKKKELDIVLSLPGLFEKTWQSLGFICFSKCVRRNDYEFVEKIIDFFSFYVKNLICTLQEAGATNFLVADDCGYKNRTFISDKIWRRLFFDAYKDIVEIIHNRNQKIIIHSDGYITKMIQTFIDLGFDAIQSLEPKSGVDIFYLFKMFKNNICFIGNLDISDLTFQTPQQIKLYVEKIISEAKKCKTPLIISPTQQIQAHIKPENIKMMIESTKNG